MSDSTLYPSETKVPAASSARRESARKPDCESVEE